MLSIPGYSFTYTYTGRNQMKDIVNGSTTLATYGYDSDGKLTSRTLDNFTSTAYTYDALDQLTWVNHSFNGAGRWFNYGYDAQSGNRKWTRRWNGQEILGDVFDYDLADQVSGVQLNVLNPETVQSVPRTILYDANGNRTWFTAYPPNGQYVTNDLNQYTSRNSINAAYDNNGNMRTAFDNSTYVYDAQNRLTSASKSGVTETFKYDGLNRQVSRTVGGVTTYSVWDGWDLVEEYTNSGAYSPKARYLHGPTGLVKNLTTNNYYYQDGSGSTSHLASSAGALLEWYRYDLQGTPIFYTPWNTELSASNYSVRHLFTGQQWYSELGLYDLRNRFYSPDIGRFLQPDPIGFAGDPTNLYRYCGNNPVNWSDPSGLQKVVLYPEQRVSGSPLPGGFHTAQESSSLNYSPFGLGDPAIFGGGGHGGPHVGGRPIVKTKSRPDASQLGTSPGAPWSTQGFWTDLSGIPIGSAWVVELIVLAEIPGEFEHGMKILQSVTLNSWGEVVSSYSRGGYTNVLGLPILGLYRTNYSVLNNHPLVTVTMNGTAVSTPIALLSGPILSLDYSFRISLNLATQSAWLSGVHDGYPSYNVSVGDRTLYDFQERSLIDLAPPMEIQAEAGTIHW